MFSVHLSYIFHGQQYQNIESVATKMHKGVPFVVDEL
jgi:hypothetical protein